MMKHLLLIAILSLSALPPSHLEPLVLVHEEYKLNSGSRPGGHSRALIKIVVPPHCQYLVYAIYASPRNPLQDLGLHSQLRERLHANGGGLSIGSSILNTLTAPPADGVTDVVLTRSHTAAQAYMAHQPAPMLEDYCRYNIANAIVAMPLKYSSQPDTLYMCLRNPGAIMAEYVTVEVEALKRY